MAGVIRRLWWNTESWLNYSVTLIRPDAGPGLIYAAPDGKELVVSLTSYPPRFNRLVAVLKTLIYQTVRPGSIELWVAKDDVAKLPRAIWELVDQSNWLKVKTTSDLRSYKKIVPALIENPDRHLVTADDDVLYPREWLRSLLASWSGSHSQIVAHRAHSVMFCDSSEVAPYDTWPCALPAAEDVGPLFPTGIGGVLYPARSLHEEVTNISSLLKLCPLADDIWLFWMGRLAGSTVNLAKGFNIVNTPGSHHSGLAAHNVSRRGNDEQLANMTAYYGAVW